MNARSLIPKVGNPSKISFTPARHGWLQRECACGGAAGPGGECERCAKKREHGLQRPAGSGFESDFSGVRIASSSRLAVNRPGDAFEQEADRAAEAVVSGHDAPVGNYAPPSMLQRDDAQTGPPPAKKEPTNEEKYLAALKKFGEAFLETSTGKELKGKAEELGKDFVSSVEGKVIAGTALGGALAALIAANKELPVPIPEIPLDFIAPGLKAKLVWEGPMRNPTSASLTLTTKSRVSVGASYSKTDASPGKPEEQKAGLTLTIPLGGSPSKPKSGADKNEKFRSETARMAADQDKFREGMKSDAQKAAEKKEYWDTFWRMKAMERKQDDDLMLMRKAESGMSAMGSAPPVVHEVLSRGGQPLDAGTREFMETRFGHDFSQVRVHTGPPAEESARAVNALAYTVGHHIAFGTGRYSPQTEAGGRLLAHELAHVVQQRRGPAAVHGHRAVSEPGDLAEREADTAADLAMRGLPTPSLVQAAAPVSLFPYQTIGTTLNRSNIATLTGVSYWVQRTGDRYDFVQSPRMAADPEEQSAVLAAVWAGNPPATVSAHSERIVPVNPRPALAAAPGSPALTAPPALLYRFKFDPPAAPGGKPRLECEFIATGPGAIPLTAPIPAAGFTPGTLNANSDGFPGGRDAYFVAHPQEFAQLMSFLASAPPAFDQHLTTETRNARSRVTHTSLLHAVRVAGTGAAAASLDVDLVAEQAPLAPVDAPADYLTRDASDFEIEKLQRTTIAAANRLGPVTLPAGLSPAEHLAVNLAITAYFGNGARNTEVDAIVPVGATGTATVLFTLRFGAANAVTVERIGAVGTGTGMVNPSRIDVRRIASFPGATATDAALRAWWTARYPAGGALQTPVPGPAPAPGTTPAPPNNTALLTEMNALIAAGIANSSWFSGNYGIEPLGPTAATTRLRDVHHAPAATDATLGTLADGTKSFTAADLVLLELSLQTASTTVLNALRGVQLIRMTNAITRSGTTWQFGPASTYGFTVMDGTERSTLLFDSFTQSDTSLFRGGSTATALPDSTMSILHELGHAAGFQGGVETAFNAWRAAHPQAAQTWYAASAGSEVFPEAFALFQTDPHFLCGSAPLLYAWFLEWTTTGTPPAASATLTAPTTCPP